MRECVRETIALKTFIMQMQFLFPQGNHRQELNK